MSVDSPGIVLASFGKRGQSWTFRHCRDTETTTASLPSRKMHSATRGLTANILCHASSTWTTRHRLRGGDLKGARCICPYGVAELLALPHLLKLMGCQHSQHGLARVLRHVVEVGSLLNPHGCLAPLLTGTLGELIVGFPGGVATKLCLCVLPSRGNSREGLVSCNAVLEWAQIPAQSCHCETAPNCSVATERATLSTRQATFASHLSSSYSFLWSSTQ